MPPRRMLRHCPDVYKRQDVDCANCANKMEDAAKNTAGVKDATVNFMTLKMSVEFEEGQDLSLIHI